jgi:hypothetical protein
VSIQESVWGLAMNKVPAWQIDMERIVALESPSGSPHT